MVTTENELVVLDAGQPSWRERLPGRVITAPLVAGERVFVQSVDRSVRAYDAVNGRWLWQYQRPGSDPLSLAQPGVLSAFRDTLVVGYSSRVVGLDPTRGSVRFEASLGVPVAATRSSVWPIWWGQPLALTTICVFAPSSFPWAAWT